VANLFRLLGLPDPAKVRSSETRRKRATADPGPQDGDLHLDLGDQKWSEMTRRLTPGAERSVIYVKPDLMHRLPLEGISVPLSRGSLVIVDLGPLIHMPSQRDRCKRMVQEMAERLGLYAFAINEDDSLLMVPGAMMRVDTKNYELGIGGFDQLSES
tara:strand:+ start:1867 stop:2337 length:471 start_codon:yes stop_codon:yes gene_type:complete